MARSVCVYVCVLERARGREWGFDRGQKEEKGRGKKLELGPNSIEGERSQFSLAAEGRLQQLVNSCGRDQRPLPILHVWQEEIGHTLFAAALADEWERKREQMAGK